MYSLVPWVSAQRGYGNPKLQGPVAFSRLVCEAGHVTFAQASVWVYRGQAVETHWRERVRDRARQMQEKEKTFVF